MITMSENKQIVKNATAEVDSFQIRISKILDDLIEGNEDFKEIDKAQMMNSLSDLLEKPPHELISITDYELARRIEKVILIEALSGILNDLSPAEIESFEAASKRREFFG